MRPLNLTRININSPYKVWFEDEEYRFITDSNILYAMVFDPDILFSYPFYWFNLTNRGGIKYPNDLKLQKTIVCVIEEFFMTNQNMLLYMCDTANGQQAMRSRLFVRWFNNYSKNKDFVIRSTIVNDNGEDNFISIIIKRTHPQFKEIIHQFDRQISMFKEHKPE